MYIAIDAVDISLRDNVFVALKKHFSATRVAFVRDAGSTDFSENMARGMNSANGLRISNMAALYAKYAGRIDSVINKVVPALVNERTVISEGSWIQSYVDYADNDAVFKKIHRTFTDDFPIPDITIYLQPPENHVSAANNKYKRMLETAPRTVSLDAKKSVYVLALEIIYLVEKHVKENKTQEQELKMII